MPFIEIPVTPHRAFDSPPRPPEGKARPPFAVAQPSGVQPAQHYRDPEGPQVPDYLRDTYTLAYLRPTSVWLLDRFWVVNAILWGNYPRLLRSALAEIRPGQRVYQSACVYGDFSHQVAAVLGPDGHLDIGDVAPVQVENCRRKLSKCNNATVHLWNAADDGFETYDVVCSFFLLHEIPEDYKHRVVDALLKAVPPGGKVVFVDYHRPHRAHPLKWIMNFINNNLEPFANALWVNEIAGYSSWATDFTWTKQTYFGGLYQKVVAVRR